MTPVRAKRVWLGAAGVVALAGCASKDTATDTTYTREQLMDPETCKECHAQHYKEWSGSMHAYAATDPVFLAMNARGQRETKGALGSFCINCHAPLAVQEHAADGGTDLSRLPKQLQGVTCYFCHQVEDVQGTHDDPLVLASDTTMRGGITDPAPNPAHKGKFSKLHEQNHISDSSSLCGACHDIVVPAQFSGAKEDVHLERTYAEWQDSLFSKTSLPGGGVLNPESCGNCHMGIAEAGVPVASKPGLAVPGGRNRHTHEFAGVDVALTDGFPEKEAQRASIQAQLDGSMVVSVCVGDGRNQVRVAVDNIGAGHMLPSGATQDRRLWVELHAYGAHDEELFSSGAVPSGVSVAESGDPDLWLFRDVTVNRDGKPAHMFWDVASIDSSHQQPIPATVTLDQLAPQWHVEKQEKIYGKQSLTTVSRVDVTVHMQPIGREVLADLEASGDLDANLPDGAPGRVADAMPTFDVAPNETDAGSRRTIRWTTAAASTVGKKIGDDTTHCVDSSSLRPTRK